MPTPPTPPTPPMSVHQVHLIGLNFDSLTIYVTGV